MTEAIYHNVHAIITVPEKLDLPISFTFRCRSSLGGGGGGGGGGKSLFRRPNFLRGPRYLRNSAPGKIASDSGEGCTRAASLFSFYKAFPADITVKNNTPASCFTLILVIPLLSCPLLSPMSLFLFPAQQSFSDSLAICFLGFQEAVRT